MTNLFDEQKELDIKKMTFKIELLLILLFLFCSACGNSKQQQAAQAQIAAIATGKEDAVKIENSTEQTCGRQTFPKYIDVASQRYIENEIESGSAHVILHFKVDCSTVDKPTCDALGQQALDNFLSQNSGVLEVGSQWPDWAAMSLVVNESGLRQLAQDCSVDIIEADKQESVQ